MVSLMNISKRCILLALLAIFVVISTVVYAASTLDAVFREDEDMYVIYFTDPLYKEKCEFEMYAYVSAYDNGLYLYDIEHDYHAYGKNVEGPIPIYIEPLSLKLDIYPKKEDKAVYAYTYLRLLDCMYDKNRGKYVCYLMANADGGIKYVIIVFMDRVEVEAYIESGEEPGP